MKMYDEGLVEIVESACRTEEDESECLGLDAEMMESCLPGLHCVDLHPKAGVDPSEANNDCHGVLRGSWVNTEDTLVFEVTELGVLELAEWLSSMHVVHPTDAGMVGIGSRVFVAFWWGY